MATAATKPKSVKTTTEKPSQKKRAGKKLSLVRWLPPLCVVVLTLLAFLPALQNGFVGWDDAGNLIENSHYRGLGWDELLWMFSSFSLGLYRPVAWMTFGLDYFLWGMAPAGYHLTSILFHCANALLFYFVALRLLRLSIPSAAETPVRLAAGFAALFFSLHPLRVEAVAWASARGDVVASFFLLVAVLCYLRATVNAQDFGQYRRWLTSTLLSYAVSLLAKGSGIPFPFVLLALDVYPLRRLSGSPRKWFSPETRRVWWEKVPFLLLAIAAGAAAVIAKRGTQDVYSIGKYDLWAKITEPLYGLSFYLWKTLVPLSLSPLYQRPDRLDPSQSIFWIHLLLVCAGVVTTGALIALRRRCPGGLTTWVYYAVTLAPVLGIVQFGPQLVADRYSYLACLGWALLAGAALTHLWHSPRPRALSPATLNFTRATAVTLLFVLGFLSWRQTQVWHDTERLWRHALSVDPNSSYAYTNLAAAMAVDSGKIDEAIRYYGKAASLRPDWTLPLFNLGEISQGLGKLDEAAGYYRKVLAIDPKYVKGYQQLAAVLAKQGRFDEAVALYSNALRVDPNDASVHNDFGNMLVNMGEFAGAVNHYRKAAELDPNRSEPYFNLGNLMVRQGALEQAFGYYRQALQIDPDYAQAHHNLGRLLAAQGKLDEAVDHFRQAVRAQPSFMAARESLVAALQQQGKNDEASREYAEAMQMLQSRGPGSNP